MGIDFAKARDIFAAAVEKLDSDEQRAYLEDACGTDSELRRHVDLLLSAHKQSGSFLDRGAVPEATVVFPLSESAGTIIGPYKLLQQIGEGGMGVVFMAEQHEPIRRMVAIKIIKPGMDSRQVIARFEAERQALAVLDHPNIARVLDAGTTNAGRPYFVMELVKGVSITMYCDQRQFSVRQRLELMSAVCHAVQHAHQKGIIHRDIKPSNVLVAEYDGKAMPKVIDFGVAKATAQQLTEKTMFTQYGQIVGTFEYMSPEQARFNQLDVDTRSDIYSLGVLLYELLAGSTPLERERLQTAAFEQILHMISEEEPPRPSMRIGSSASLPSIAAHRGLEPKRLAGLLRGDLDWIVMKALEKDRSRRYETASGLARDLEHFLVDEPVQARPPSTVYRLQKFVRRYKLPVAASLLLATAVMGGLGLSSWMYFQERAARERAVAAEEKSNQWLALLKGLMWGDGSTPEAHDLQRLQEVLDELATADATVGDAQALNNLGLELRNRGRFPEALILLRRALEIFGLVYSEDNSETLACLNNLALTLHDHGKLDEAEQASRQAVSMSKRLWGPESLQAAKQLNDLGTILREQRRYDDAAEVLQLALTIREREGAKGFPTAESTFHLAEVQRDRGDLAEAEQTYRKALQMFHDTPTAGDAAVVGATLELATTLLAEDKFDEAKKLAAECINTYKRIDPRSSTWQAFYTRSVLGEALTGKKEFAEAEPLLQTAYDGMRPHKSSIPKQYYREVIERLAKYYRTIGRANEAAKWQGVLDEFDGNPVAKQVDAAERGLSSAQ